MPFWLVVALRAGGLSLPPCHLQSTCSQLSASMVLGCASLLLAHAKPLFQLWCFRQEQTLAAEMELMASLLGEKVRDFQNFMSPHSQQSQTTVVNQPQTTEHLLAHAEDYSWEEKGCFPLELSFLLLKAKKKQKPFNNMFSWVHGFNIKQQA